MVLEAVLHRTWGGFDVNTISRISFTFGKLTSAEREQVVGISVIGKISIGST